MSERTELPVREERCETCRFWEADGIGGGDCRHHPPVIDPMYVGLKIAQRSHETDFDEDFIIGRILRAFPLTESDDWCGEWKAKDGAKANGDPPQLRLRRPESPPVPKIPDGETSLVELELSVRTHNVIEMSGIATIEQLTRYTATHLRAINGFGLASAIEVRTKLAERGLKLSGE